MLQKSLRSSRLFLRRIGYKDSEESIRRREADDCHAHGARQDEILSRTKIPVIQRSDKPVQGVLLRRSGSESESEDDAERRKKPIPKWARGPALAQALVAQLAVDPDEIFKLHQKTCPLNEVFSDRGGFLSSPCDRLSIVP